MSALDDLAGRRPGAAARERAGDLARRRPWHTLFARVFAVHTDERAWRIGADGEEKVGAQLDRLVRRDPRWRVLHSVPVGDRGSDIDHVVIGPAGVFTLNTKHHPAAAVWVGGDTFMVNGRRMPYVRNSRHEATRAGRLLTAASGLPVEAIGVIVPVAARSLAIKAAPLDVQIVTRRRLAGWLRQRPEVLPDETVEAIYDVARRPETWRPAR